MRLSQIIQARGAIGHLTHIRLRNFSATRKLAALKKRVDEESDFFEQEQNKAIMEYAEFSDGKPVFTEDKCIRLKDEASKAAFEGEMHRLLDIEVDDVEPVILSESDFRNDSDYPTPEEMLALEGLVEFKEE